MGLKKSTILIGIVGIALLFFVFSRLSASAPVFVVMVAIIGGFIGMILYKSSKEI